MSDKERFDIDSIKAWQQDFYRGVFEPTTENIEKACADIHQAVELNSAQFFSARLSSDELPSSFLLPSDRLAIYRNSILGGITAGLMGIYPVCNRLVGDIFFTHMVAGYLKQYPSASPDVGHYGGFLGDYVEGFLIKINQQNTLEYLPDVARLEWLWHQAFNSEEAFSRVEVREEGQEKENSYQVIMPLTELGNVGEENQGNILFQLQPSLGLLASNYPIDEIWQANQESELEAELEKEVELSSIELINESRDFAIWRSPDFSMHIEKISIAGGSAFLQDIKKGLPFSSIAAQKYPSSIDVLLPYFLQSGLIVGFKLES